MRHRVGTALALMLVVPLSAGESRAESPPPDIGRPWEPRPVSRPLYGIQAPTDHNRQRHVVQAADGIGLFTETWLPARKRGKTPPRRLPTIMLATPYDDRGTLYDPIPGLVRDHLVARGYAFTSMHVRGSGQSGGCFDSFDSIEIEDIARVIQYLGRDAPWANGAVGMYGTSYAGDAQLAVAGRGDQRKTRYLQAIVPIEAIGGQYEIDNFDGVPFSYLQGQGVNNLVYDLWTVSAVRPNTPPLALPQRAECQPEQAVANVESSGDVTPYWADHEYRAAAHRVRAATLLVHGFADSQRDPAPFFENLSPSIPRMMLTGWWEHTTPGDDGLHERRIHPEWARADWLDLLTAWYDRYLKRLPVATRSWPRVQVQGSDGQWRSEPNWPVTGGPVGQLALGPAGALGAAAPSTTTTYTETLTWRNDLPSNVAVFETRPLRGRLEITGQPILDLWVRLDRPDAHVAAQLEVLDAAGKPIPELVTVGLRSARHLEPLVRNRFAQARGKPAPVGVAIRIPVRLDLTDLVVPRAGRLRLTVSGSTPRHDPPPTTDPQAVFDPFLRFSAPSGAGTTVTILHDCKHPSALRFLMPRERPDVLNVRETDERNALRTVTGPSPASVGGGLATARVCGLKPVRLANFGPAID